MSIMEMQNDIASLKNNVKGNKYFCYYKLCLFLKSNVTTLRVQLEDMQYKLWNNSFESEDLLRDIEETHNSIMEMQNDIASLKKNIKRLSNRTDVLEENMGKLTNEQKILEEGICKFKDTQNRYNGKYPIMSNNLS
ncbi:uncharacterized protein LOC130647034 [Hydractinia symbiolongicarpus]|uniref:uncharacterized protein LOC130647034 n=1 Tax=Hydractinia symbiolongicarpus TaxID=13093 RepID=UPI00254FA6A6|nr:uncharacterized protein LOC130647034 [Hydractinia symbiolongicarpus]